MSDYPQHVSDPVDVVCAVWSAARGEGGSHRLPESGAHIGAQNLGAFRERGQCNENRHRNATLLRIRGIAHRLREARFPLKGYGMQKSMLCTSVFCVINFALAQES